MNRIKLHKLLKTYFKVVKVYKYSFNNNVLQIKYNYSTESNLNLSNKIEKYIKTVQTNYEILSKNNTEQSKEEIENLKPILEVIKKWNNLKDNLKSLEEMPLEKDEELNNLIKGEISEYKYKIQDIEQQLLEFLLPVDADDCCSSIILEVTAGVGGQEAMLFASELFRMYTQYADYRNWDYQVAEMDTSELGGVRHASLIIEGNGVFKELRHEGGVHRVQRVPSTEKSGRIHTSTVTVAVLPEPDEVDIQIRDQDLKVETKRASGAGGQHVNTTDSAVRIVHLPSGLAVECQTERSQIKNRRIALQRLKAKLYQQEQDSRFAETRASRKSQVGSSLRNEKIRTYNYNQDRITDHRLQGGSVFNLKGFLMGGEALEKLICRLEGDMKRKKVLEVIDDLK